MINNGNGMTGSWMWSFAGLMMLGTIVLIGVAVWAVLTARHRPHPTDSTTDGLSSTADRNRARRVLDERYAQGDISSDDYSERLRTLGYGPDLT